MERLQSAGMIRLYSPFPDSMLFWGQPMLSKCFERLRRLLTADKVRHFDLN
jgi:hypothetical protein